MLYKIPVDFDATHALKEKFMEVYGENVKVPLMQIIDSNRFDGGSLVDLSRIGTNGEEEVLHIIENKIQQAFILKRIGIENYSNAYPFYIISNTTNHDLLLYVPSILIPIFAKNINHWLCEIESLSSLPKQ